MEDFAVEEKQDLDKLEMALQYLMEITHVKRYELENIEKNIKQDAI